MRVVDASTYVHTERVKRGLGCIAPAKRRIFKGMNDLNASMATALLSFMDDTEISQAAVARHLGRSKTYVSQRLSGMYPVSLDIAAAVAELARLTPVGLMVELSERMRVATPLEQRPPA